MRVQKEKMFLVFHHTLINFKIEKKLLKTPILVGYLNDKGTFHISDITELIGWQLKNAK